MTRDADRRESATEEEPVKVAIVGGGCGGISAAFELTRKEHRGKFEVTVYQVGWRLGGKGASGRGPDDRIEEHGLHIWLGFYENAFRLMRECYEELDRPRTSRIIDWRDAFFPDPRVGVAEKLRGGEWQQYLAHFPPASGEPGDPDRVHEPITLVDYLVRAASLLTTLIFAVQNRELRTEGRWDRATGGPSGPRHRAEPPDDASEPIMSTVARLLKTGPILTAAALIESVRLLETLLGTPENYSSTASLRFIDRIASGAQRIVELTVGDDPELRRLWEMIDLILAIVRGCVRDGVVTHRDGLDSIDHWDCRDWLVAHGASPKSVDSAIVRGLYDLALAYENGDERKAGLAAGQAIRGAFRMFFTYRGALFWKMRAGMGDIVFAPFYEVLKKRGVRFEFFHRLENVRLCDEQSLRRGEHPHVAALEFDVQAELKDPVAGYQPLVDVKGLPSWPATPDYDQLVDGERLREEPWSFESHWDRRKAGTKTLHVVEDFDFVVIALGGGAIPHVCKELIDFNEDWRDMAANLNTVETQAFQLWLKEDLEQLGWDFRSASISAFEKPFDTWADMSHLASEESFADAPRSIAYFCGVLPCGPTAPDRGDDGYPLLKRALVRDNAVNYLNWSIAHLWPRAMRPGGGFRWDCLVSPNGGPPSETTGTASAPFDSQYWTANVNPSDRYVLALPGTTTFRISPLDYTFDNLTIAGDWTACGFNEGCVEAAVISGRLAATALSTLPRLEDIFGYDHP